MAKKKSVKAKSLTIEDYVDKWKGIALDTRPANREAAEKAINALYKHSSLEAPLIVWAQSIPTLCNTAVMYGKNEYIFNKLAPVIHVSSADHPRHRSTVTMAANRLEDELSHLNSYLHQMPYVRASIEKASWRRENFNKFFVFGTSTRREQRPNSYITSLMICDYLVNQTECDVDAQSKAQIKALIRIAKHASWFVPHKDVCLIADRPSVLKLSQDNRVHCEDGPAIEFRDGIRYYVWRDRTIPKKWISEPGYLTANRALGYENAETRRAACEFLGWGNILTQLNAQVIDSNKDPKIGTLVRVNIAGFRGTQQFLRVECGTSREFALPVPPGMKTAIQAQAWINGVSEETVKKLEVRT